MLKQYTLLFFLTMLSGSCIAMESTTEDVQSDGKEDTSLTAKEADQNALTVFDNLGDKIPIVISLLIQWEAMQANNIKHLHETIGELRLVSSRFCAGVRWALLDKQGLKSILSAYVGNSEVSHMPNNLFSPEQKQLIVDCLMPIMQKKGADLNQFEQHLVTLFSDLQDTMAKQSEDPGPIDFDPTRTQLISLLEPALRCDYWPLVQLAISYAQTDADIDAILKIIYPHYQEKQTNKVKYERLAETACSRMHDQQAAARIRSFFTPINPSEKEFMSGNTLANDFMSLALHYKLNSSQMIQQILSNTRILPINTKLWQAAFNGDTTTVEQIVTSNEFASQDGTANIIGIALFFAISGGHKACVLLLLNQNRDETILFGFCIPATLISEDVAIIDAIIQNVPVEHFNSLIYHYIVTVTASSSVFSKNARKVVGQTICQKVQSTDPTFTNNHIKLLLSCMEDNAEQVQFLVTQLEQHDLTINFAMMALILSKKQDLIELFLSQEHLGWTRGALNELADLAERYGQQGIAKLFLEKSSTA